MNDTVQEIEEKLGEIIIGNEPTKAAEVIRRIMFQLAGNRSTANVFLEVNRTIDMVCESEFG